MAIAQRRYTLAFVVAVITATLGMSGAASAAGSNIPHPADASRAPTQAIASGHLSVDIGRCAFGTCVLFSREETRQIAEAPTLGVIGLLVAFCGRIPNPAGAAICAGAATLSAPVVQKVARAARAAGKCLGIGNAYPGARYPTPTVGNCSDG